MGTRSRPRGADHKDEPAGAALANDQQDSHDMQAGPSCALCLAGSAGSDLISAPCACRGSVGHVHAACLLRWQQVLQHCGQAERALTCAICGQPYCGQFAALPLPLPDDAACTSSGSGPASSWQRLQQLLRRVLHRLAQSPQGAWRLWRLAVLVAGIAAGARQGCAGAAIGLCVGVRLAKPAALLLAGLAPGVGLLTALVPTAKPAKLLLALGGGVVVVEVALAVGLGLFLGGAAGFCHGAWQVAARSVQATGLLGRAGAHTTLALLAALGLAAGGEEAGGAAAGGGSGGDTLRKPWASTAAGALAWRWGPAAQRML